jgi:hypothetical protein
VRFVGNGRELISIGRESVGTGNDRGGSDGDLPASPGQEAADYRREPIGNDHEPVGNGRESARADAHARHRDSSSLPEDAARTKMLADSANGAAEPTPAAGEGRHAPPVTADEGSLWSASPVRRAAAATDSDKPWLPRRVRQASLAPQLKTDVLAVSEDARGTTAGAEDADGLGPEGPNPADTRALVQSLQFGLDLARTTDAPTDESWPPTDESPLPRASEPWPSPAGSPDLAAGPEDNGGQ